LFNCFPNYYPSGQVGYTAFYMAIFLIAHQLKGKKIPTKIIPLAYGIVAAALVWMFYYYGMEIFYKINKQKFPPKIPYIIWSLFSLTTLFVLYNRLKIVKNNFICYIGKNAIFYYFAQGISSSLIYFIVVSFKETIHWVPFMIGVYLINIVLAVGIAEVLKKIDALGWRILSFLRTKTAKP